MNNPEKESLYRVFEEIEGQLAPRMVGSYAKDSRTGEFHKSLWNDKKRIYTDYSTALTYKKRLAKEGRIARIFRYTLDEEVTE